MRDKGFPGTAGSTAAPSGSQAARTETRGDFDGKTALAVSPKKGDKKEMMMGRQRHPVLKLQEGRQHRRFPGDPRSTIRF